ncbi:MAG: hypothetical protein ACTTI6_02080 [Treponema sp.]
MEKRIRQILSSAQNNEAGIIPFETQSGEILKVLPHYSAGNLSNV